MKLCIALCCGIFATPALGQGATVQGRVHDELTAGPVAGATIRVAGTALVTRAAADGAYRLPGVPRGRVTLRIEADRYVTQRHELEIDHEGTIIFPVALTPVAH